MTTVNSDMIIYNQLAQTAYLERLQDNLNVFNEASAGAIVYRNEIIEGDFSKDSFYRVGGSIKHRDVYSNAKVNPEKIGAGESVGVKIPYKYGPYASTEEAFKHRARTPEEFAMILRYDLADALVAGRLQYSLASLKAAITSNPDMVAKGSIAVDGRKALTRGMRKFGDKFGRISLWVMNSDTYFDIVDDAITKQIYGESEIVIYGGLPGTLGKVIYNGKEQLLKRKKVKADSVESEKEYQEGTEAISSFEQIAIDFIDSLDLKDPNASFNSFGIPLYRA